MLTETYFSALAEVSGIVFAHRFSKKKYYFFLCWSLASTDMVVCGTMRRRSFGMSLPVTLQMP